MTLPKAAIQEICDWITQPDTIAEQTGRLNQARAAIADASPYRDHPVDYIEWVDMGQVEANAYNPNAVAPPEMDLLALSIKSDGFTQPVVTHRLDTHREVVDGFHRNRVGKEIAEVTDSIHGHLPVVTIREESEDLGNRMAATIRHNRARGTHQVVKMSEIVNDLKRRNWTEGRIMNALGMDADEVLRLSQIGGLQAEFAERDFSLAWEAEEIDGEDVDELEGVLSDAE